MLHAAVIGLGWWGRNIVAQSRDSSEVRVVAASDVDPAAAGFAAEHGIGFVQSLDAVLALPEVEAVILCTPHSLHHRQVLAAAAAGKHVFCEKPLCLTREDAVEAVAACRQAGVVLGIGHEKRFEPPIEAIRSMVAEGALGTLLQIEANFSQNFFLGLKPDNWRLSANEAPAGPMTATGIHLVDLAVSFLGEPECATASVSTIASGLKNGDTLGALIRFRSGANALISAVLATPFDGRFAVYGSRGWADVRDNAHPQAPAGWTLTCCDAEGKRTIRTFPPAPAVRWNIEAFARAAAGRDTYPVTDVEMVATITALEAIVESARTRATIAIPSASAPG